MGDERPTCDTPGCGGSIPPGGEGDPEICPFCLEEEKRIEMGVVAAPIPMRLTCPECGELHLDVGEFASKRHHTHACQECGAVWRPAVVATVGVRFLPGFKNPPAPPKGPGRP
jgi:uncharacterized Zn finger protein